MGHYPTSIHAADRSRLAAIAQKYWDVPVRRALNLFGCELVEDFCEVGNLSVNLADWTITWRGQRLEFSVSEVKIILALVERPGVCLTYREVYDAVRGPNFHVGEGPNGHRNAARTHIKRIRAKLRAVDPAFDQIETRPGFGYLLGTKSAGADKATEHAATRETCADATILDGSP